MKISASFYQSYSFIQGKPVTSIKVIVYEGVITLADLGLIFECSLGSFVVNGQDTGQQKLSCHTGNMGEASVVIIGSDTSGDGQLTVSQGNGQKIGVQPYHFKATAHYALNFNVMNNHAMSDGVHSNKVNVILTGTGSGVNLYKRKLDLSVTGSASFKKGQLIQSTTVETDTSGNASIELYDTNQEGETVTLTGFLDGSKVTRATQQLHFQRALDCDAFPPDNGEYIRTIFTYSINNQRYLFRQRECDHLVTVHQLISGGKQGELVSTGQKWTNFYDLIFPFVIEKEQYIFGLAKHFINMSENTHKTYWMIAKLDKNGHKEIVEHGYWDSVYDVGFAYTIGDKNFIYLHSKNSNIKGRYNFIIREIFDNGEMGPIKTDSDWANFYGPTFCYSLDGKTYFYGQAEADFSFFVYELEENGSIGEMIQSGVLEPYCEVQFANSADHEYLCPGCSLYHYCAMQCFNDKEWRGFPILGGDIRMDVKNVHCHLDTFYQYQIPFEIYDDNNGYEYLLLQTTDKNRWIIKRVNTPFMGDPPTLGETTDSSSNH
ncbi:conserved protein of unknown function [Xenorhabdus poinarii G6]|uniref:Big-1 domain-containing protein n=1 Tax=Xenorhabdus poinarii G6 TaxID=1354304 RepID=A0A068R6U2_9GAMM|nr:hypothetical protein [Xenorhabdus poinarii]CDG22992.1 conserved protein of unknown function [Xenorhabdus poinarii G6]